MPRKAKLLLCPVCHHNLFRHGPKCSCKSCPCHHDPDRKPEFYIVRRTVQELLMDIDDRPQFLWGFDKNKEWRPLPRNEQERQYVQAIEKRHKNLCERLQTRIHNLSYREGQDAEVLGPPKPVFYIPPAPEKPTEPKPVLRTNPRRRQRIRSVHPVKPSIRRPKRAIGKNKRKFKGKAGPKKRAGSI